MGRKDTLLEFYRLFYNEKRFEEGAMLLAEGFINHHAGAEGRGRRAMVEGFGRASQAFPSFHIEAKRLAQEGDFVWAHSLITGLPGEAMAISVDIWRFEGDTIAEHWDVAQGVKPGQDPGSMW